MRIIRFLLVLAIFSICFPLNSPARSPAENGIPILLYHHVSDDKTDLPKLTVSNEVFDMQMKKLYQAGFRTIPTDDLIAYMSGEKVALPDKPFMISFDDGYENNYTNAFPILKKYGFKAVIFMVGVNINAPHRLSKEQMREMSEYGIEFGSHSQTHRDMTSLSPSELKREVNIPKKAIEEVTKKRVRLFSYPYGFYNLPVFEKIISSDFDGAVAVHRGPVRYGYDNIYLMRRIYILRNTNFDLLFAELDAKQPKIPFLNYLPELDEDE